MSPAEIRAELIEAASFALELASMARRDGNAAAAAENLSLAVRFTRDAIAA